MPSRNRRASKLAATVAIAAVAAIAALGAAAMAQSRGPVKSLRGEVEMEANGPPPAVVKQDLPADGMFNRAYRQQPPLIPHRIDGYQVTKDFNQCMTCHDWPANTKAGAPKVSETHYSDRAGQRLDKISGTRFFCTQCHVLQQNARPLVENEFKNAIEVK